MMQPNSWRFQGGLDLTTSALQRNRRGGALIGCMNYESRLEGYRRTDGYERFDGRPAPSADFNDIPNQRLARIRARREAIEEVPGFGDINGVWRFKDATYAIRNDSDGDPVLYKSSQDGWVEVDTGYSCEFSRGSGREPAAGEEVSAFGTDGTVLGVFTRAGGTWQSGTAEGVLAVLFDSAPGWKRGTIATFNDESGRTVQLNTAMSKQTLAPADRYRFINYNFYARAGQERMYGIANAEGGVNVFEFDGKAFFRLNTGIPAGNVPSEVEAHQNHLFVGYEGGTILHGNLGDPRGFSALKGAAEFGIGDELTGMLAGYRKTMIVYGRNKTAALFGTSAADWQLDVISSEAGAMRDTAVIMNEPVCLDDRGIRKLSTTESFGDLDIATISEPIRPLLDFLREGGVQPVASVRVRRKSQYRIFFDDGQCIVASYIPRGRGINIEFTTSNYDLFDSEAAPDYPVPGIITSICSVEDSNGRERIFFAMKGSGYVYEMDKGTSFDGHRIQAYLRLPYNDLGRPDVIKRFRKIQMECDSTYRSRFSMGADFHDDRVSGGKREKFAVVGPRSYWDEQAWSDFDWDGKPIRVADQRISGRGRNISVLVFSEQTDEPSHVFSGVTVLYDNRKLKR